MQDYFVKDKLTYILDHIKGTQIEMNFVREAYFNLYLVRFGHQNDERLKKILDEILANLHEVTFGLVRIFIEEDFTKAYEKYLEERKKCDEEFKKMHDEEMRK